MQHLNNTPLVEAPFPTMSKKSNPHFTTRQKQIIRSVGAVACFASELIHLWLLPEQYEVFVGYGLIFLLIAMAQGGIGANLVFAPRRRLLTFGLWVNGLLVVLYLFTHTVGVLVAEAFLPLPVDPFGVAATLCEMLVIGMLFLLVRESPKEPKRKKTRGSVQRRQARSPFVKEK